MSCRTLSVPCRALALNTQLNILAHFAHITKSGGLGWILLLHIIKFMLSLHCHHVPHLSFSQSIAMKATTCLAFMGGLCSLGLPLFLPMVHKIHIKFHFKVKNFDLLLPTVPLSFGLQPVHSVDCIYLVSKMNVQEMMDLHSAMPSTLLISPCMSSDQNHANDPCLVPLWDGSIAIVVTFKCSFSNI